jgi:hypothetical protein
MGRWGDRIPAAALKPLTEPPKTPVGDRSQVATRTSVAGSAFALTSSAINATSDDPGSRVAERNPLENNSHRAAKSVTGVFSLSGSAIAIAEPDARQQGNWPTCKADERGIKVRQEGGPISATRAVKAFASKCLRIWWPFQGRPPASSSQINALRGDLANPSGMFQRFLRRWLQLDAAYAWPDEDQH